MPLGARIIAVVDAFDAMTVTRPYHPAIPVAQARAELLRCAGSSFDPDVVAAFVRVLARLEQEGITVSLALGAALEETRAEAERPMNNLKRSR